MRFMKRIVMLLFLSVMVCTLSAQEKKGETIGERIVANAYNADSIRGILDKMPYFTLFKDNYFVGGTTLGHKPTAANSDVKFQLSIAQRLTKSKLPFDTYLFIQYTQKAFWNVFQESLPMKDLNFNPGIGLGHLIVYHNKYIGKGYLMLEHESKDLLKYNGIFQVAANYRTDNRRFNCGVILTKRKTWTSFNTQVELSYKFNNNENQYFFLQYYNGYGENLLEYNKFKSMIRIGFVIKPSDFSLY